jgi:AraC family transcriptional regulator, transcriptional activator FtrA
MTPRRRGPANRLVVVLVADRLALFEFGIVMEVFGLRRLELGVPWYDVAVVSFDPAPLTATSGVQVFPTHSTRMLAKAGTIVIPGWRDLETPPDPHVVKAVAAAHARGARVVSVCSGAFVLAAAGLLDGKRATTHWRHSDTLARCYPRVQVDPSVLYVENDRVYTSAGSAAGIDLCLHIVRQDYGSDIANQVARRMVVSPHRDGGQAQFVAAAMPPVEGSLAPLMEWATARLDQPLSAEALAGKALPGAGRHDAASVAHLPARAGGAATARDVRRLGRARRRAGRIRDRRDAAASLQAARRHVANGLPQALRAVGVTGAGALLTP